MRYSVPVQAAGEVGVLAHAGAGELYCGYLDEWWAVRYGDHDSASRRQGAANIQDAEELRATVQASQRAGLPLHLALNSRYTEPMLDHLVELCQRFEDWGGTGVIASDIGLLWRLRERTGLVRTLSILGVAQNVATVEAFQELGVSRVVLPRFIGPDEAGALLAAVPDVEASVMAFFDKCPWVDGYCRHRHGVSYPERAAASGEAEDGAPLYTFDTTYRTHACLRGGCGQLAPYPCAACQLAAFEHAGVGVAKLGGRGRLLEERVRALRFLREAELLGSDGERRELYQATFGVPCSCYYGERKQRRDAIEPVALPETEQGRHIIGSQTSWKACAEAIATLRACDGVHTAETAVVLLLPPLSEQEQHELVSVLPELLLALPPASHIAANDLGTLVVLSRELAKRDEAVELKLGTLLARADDPREVAHFLSPDENPPRPIYDLEGSPRTLTWAPPPQTLVDHWSRPSNTEPSARTALRHLGVSMCP